MVDCPTRRPPRFGSTTAGGCPPPPPLQPPKWLHTPRGHTLDGSSPRDSTIRLDRVLCPAPLQVPHAMEQTVTKLLKLPTAQPPVLSLANVVDEESSNTEPILLVTTAGADPSQVSRRSRRTPPPPIGVRAERGSFYKGRWGTVDCACGPVACRLTCILVDRGRLWEEMGARFGRMRPGGSWGFLLGSAGRCE